MDDDPMQFFVIGTAEFIGIRKDRIEGNHEVAIEGLAFRIVEGDNICVVVVAEIFIIDFQDLVVVDEHIADFAYLLAIRLCHTADPAGCRALPREAPSRKPGKSC